MKILVLGGGTSSEREISLRSAAAVRGALERLGHEVGYMDPRDGLEAVAEAAPGYALVMPILHGEGGEDGSIQHILDQAGVPYLGAGAQASELCFDKVWLKKLLHDNGITTPASETVTAQTFRNSPLTQSPFVLKTVSGGSSVGIMIARTLPYDETKAGELLSRHREMLLEELIEGVEITVPVLGESALPAVEIIPPPGHEFDYEYKYNGATKELSPPEHIPEEQHTQAQRLAERVHQLAGVRHLSRTDIIVTKAGLCVLEINTLPGMTDSSLYPRSAKAAGMTFDQLVERLVELALH